MKKIQRLIVIVYDILQCLLFFCKKKHNTNAVLIITPLRLGDFCMWLPFAQALLQHYSKQHKKTTLLLPKNLHYLAQEYLTFDTAILREYPDEVYSLKKIKTLNYLLKDQYEIAISTSVERAFFYDDIPRIFSRANFFYSAKAVPLSERYWGKLSILADNIFFKKHTFELKQYINTPEISNYHKLIQYICDASVTPRLFAGTMQNGTILAPFSQDPSKTWSPEQFSLLIPYLPMPIFLVGMESDFTNAQRICDSSPYPINNLCGKTSLQELNTLIKKSSIIVGTDSGIANLGIIHGKKVIAITGQANNRFIRIPADFVQFGFKVPIKVIAKKICPLAGCNYHCPYYSSGEQYPCIKNINPIDVIEILKQLSVN
jgi:ADP-heptose:LPS heptosyltransferase